MIIHISGPPDSGKTYLGKKLEKKFGKKIVVKDLDDLLNYYVRHNKFSVKGYQNYINNFIEKRKNKKIIFVGLNLDMGRSNTIYQLKPDYKFFINLNIKENAKRRFIRHYKNDIKYYFLWTYGGKEPTSEEIYKEWMKNDTLSTKSLQKIIEKMSPSGLERDTIRWHNIYKKLGFKFMTSDKIYKEISKILSK